MNYKILSVRAYGTKYSSSYITGSTESGIEVEIKITSDTEDREVTQVDTELRGLLDKAMKGLIDPPKVYLPAPNPEGDDHHAVPVDLGTQSMYFKITPNEEMNQLSKDVAFFFEEYEKIRPFYDGLARREGSIEYIDKMAERTEYNIPGWPEGTRDFNFGDNQTLKWKPIYGLDNDMNKSDFSHLIDKIWEVYLPDVNKLQFKIPKISQFTEDELTGMLKYWNEVAGKIPADDEQPEDTHGRQLYPKPELLGFPEYPKPWNISTGVTIMDHPFNRDFNDQEWDELVKIPDITKKKEKNL